MHVTQVELDNIKSYERAVFKFGKGTTAINGTNGAGKTTILEAIAWALFDVLEYNKEDFLRRGAKKGSVRVSFESNLDQRLYTVYRDTGNGYHVFDNTLKMRVAEKKTDVAKALQQHLGVEPGTDLKSLFNSAIGVPQGSFTADFLQSKEPRKKAFDKLLKVEEYRESADKLRATANLVSERLNAANLRIADAEGQLKQYDTRLAERDATAQQVAALEAIHAELSAEIATRAARVQELDEAEERVNSLRASVERLSVEHATAQRDLHNLQRERDAAQAALDRQKAIEGDHLAHLAADEKLRHLDEQRATRDHLRDAATRATRALDAANNQLARLEEAHQRATQAALQAEALAADIARQTELEQERDRLRDARAAALNERKRLQRLDIELKDLRQQYEKIHQQVKNAAQGANAQKSVHKLQSERNATEIELSRAEKAATSRGLLTRQRNTLQGQLEQLRRELTEMENGITRLVPLALHAGEADALTVREIKLQEELARLRAELAHDEKFHREVQNGLCPILSQRCLNIAEGQTLEDYFRGQFSLNRTKLDACAEEHEEVAQAARLAREAVTHVARLESVRDQWHQTRELIRERHTALTALEIELSALPFAGPEHLVGLQKRLVALDAELVTQRDAALRYAQLHPLKTREDELTEEGKAKREIYDAVKAIVDTLPALESGIAQTEQQLRALRDPRGRAAKLREEAQHAEKLQADCEQARAHSHTLALEAQACAEKLAHFNKLDEQLAKARAVHTRTRAAHHEFLRLEAQAAALPARNEAVIIAEQAVNATEKAWQDARAAHEAAAQAYQREQHALERAALIQTRERAAGNSAQLRAAQARLAELLAEITRLDEIRAALREEFAARERLQQVSDATDFIRDTLKKAGPHIAKVYAYSIGVEANQLYREITGDGSRTLEWTEDYEIVLEEDGHKRSFGSLSGGEQMVAALAVRLGLLKQLSDLRLAFFDEPTVNMDAERRARLAQQIGQIRDFDQLFVISHDDTFAESVDHTVRVPDDGYKTAKLV